MPCCICFARDTAAMAGLCARLQSFNAVISCCAWLLLTASGAESCCTSAATVLLSTSVPSSVTAAGSSEGSGVKGGKRSSVASTWLCLPNGGCDWVQELLLGLLSRAILPGGVNMSRLGPSHVTRLAEGTRRTGFAACLACVLSACNRYNWPTMNIRYYMLFSFFDMPDVRYDN